MEIQLFKSELQIILKKLSLQCDSENANVSYQLEPLSGVAGFLGNHYVMTIRTNDTSQCITAFLKAIPRNVEKRYEYIQETGIFVKETKLYEQLIPNLIPLSSVAWAPKCLLTKNDHFIVLEYLSDFKTFQSRQSIFDYDHLKKAVETLAIFHASSLVYEKKYGGFTTEQMKMLKEVSYPEAANNARNVGLESGIDVLLKLIHVIPKYQNAHSLKEIDAKFPNIMRKIYNFVKPSTVYKNVFSHGDLWVNNVMFKYDSNREKPVECKFVDFQFGRFSPPALDLATLIFTSSSADFRKVHLNDILKSYYDAFENELTLNAISTEILPKNEISESFSNYRLAGMIESALFCHLTLLPLDAAVSMMNSSKEYEKFIKECRFDKCMKAFQQEFYRSRMTEIVSGIVDEFVL
jgi:thiamine kinase-like enzyme